MSVSAERGVGGPLFLLKADMILIAADDSKNLVAKVAKRT
jgi:hypothetical protein